MTWPATIIRPKFGFRNQIRFFLFRQFLCVTGHNTKKKKWKGGGNTHIHARTSEKTQLFNTNVNSSLRAVTSKTFRRDGSYRESGRSRQQDQNYKKNEKLQK